MLSLLDLTYNDVHITIPLSYANTFITGDAGTGKTFVVSAIKNAILENNIPVYILDETHFSYYTLVPKSDEALVVIDNADLLFQMYPDSVQMFNSMKYQTLMFGRDLHGLKVHVSNYGVLSANCINGTKTLTFLTMAEYA